MEAAFQAAAISWNVFRFQRGIFGAAYGTKPSPETLWWNRLIAIPSDELLNPLMHEFKELCLKYDIKLQGREFGKIMQDIEDSLKNSPPPDYLIDFKLPVLHLNTELTDDDIEKLNTYLREVPHPTESKIDMIRSKSRNFMPDKIFYESVCPITKDEFEDDDEIVLMGCGHYMLLSSYELCYELCKTRCPMCRQEYKQYKLMFFGDIKKTTH